MVWKTGCGHGCSIGTISTAREQYHLRQIDYRPELADAKDLI
jgi:hypothetical protein